jgi:hypothetical protein
MNNNILRTFINYTCSEYDSWTGCTRGKGLIQINTTTKTIKWTKIWGTDPYWDQLMFAVLAICPPEIYRRENRVHPFKVSYREGYTGCTYYRLDLYRSLGNSEYLRFKKASELTIRSTKKLDDFSEMYIGDFIEFARFILETECELEFTRNPKWFKFNLNHVRFTRINSRDIINENDGIYDPIAVRAKMERDPDRRDPKHHRSSHRNFNHG